MDRIEKLASQLLDLKEEKKKARAACQAIHAPEGYSKYNPNFWPDCPKKQEAVEAYTYFHSVYDSCDQVQKELWDILKGKPYALPDNKYILTSDDPECAWIVEGYVCP